LPDDVLDLNLTASYLAMSAAAERMLRRRGGSIVAVSSVQGMRGFSAHAAYAAAKAGVIGLTRQMAVDYGPHGVRVNAVCPGTILTEGVRAWLDACDESSYVSGHALVVDGGLTVVGQHDAPPEPVAAQ
jgi:NAD(P)-dependent dehydrogenase (short-subunit alcohol dehydrogenase family)